MTSHTLKLNNYLHISTDTEYTVQTKKICRTSLFSHERTHQSSPLSLTLI